MPSASSRWRTWARKALWASILAGSAIASYAAVNRSVQSLRPAAYPVANNDARAQSPNRFNPFASDNGAHLIAFVVTASDCGWATRPDAMEAIRTLRAKLRSSHAGSYAKVTVVGVAIDPDPDVGLRFLTELGNGTVANAFDQVIVGGSWLNEEIVRFVWREKVVGAISPQIVVIERHVNTGSYASTFKIGIGNDKLLANPSGNVQILTWLKQGAPLTSRTKAS